MMGVILAWLVTIALLAAAGYAHHRVAFHTATPTQAWIGRGVLLAVGVAFGAVMASRPELSALAGAGLGTGPAAGSGPGSGSALQAFLAGFGLVHVPAAAVLLLKRLRARG